MPKSTESIFIKRLLNNSCVNFHPNFTKIKIDSINFILQIWDIPFGKFRDFIISNSVKPVLFICILRNNTRDRLHT